MSRVLTRRELFVRVWAQPMVKVAAEFGLSDVGLKKICAKHRIPVPGRGYWAKVAAGAAPAKALFHESSDVAIERVLIREGAALSVAEDVRAAWEAVERKVRTRKPTSRPMPEPLGGAADDPVLCRLEATLAQAKAGADGLLHGGDGESVAITVTPAALQRAIRLVYCLRQGALARGNVQDPEGAGLTVEGEPVGLQIEEKVEIVPHVPNDREAAALARWERERAARVSRGEWRVGPERPAVPECDQQAGGRLILVIDAGQHWDGLRRRFSDGKRHRLEDIVDVVLDSAAVVVMARKAARVEAERREREWAEERKRREELERQLILQDKRIEALKLPMAKFAEARDIDAFVNEYLGRHPDLPPNCRRLMDWARAYADFLRDQMAPETLEAVLEKHRLMDDDTEISKWVKIQ